MPIRKLSQALASAPFAAAAVLAMVAAAGAQNPEKFERVVPPKARPTTPGGDPLVSEVMRKALAKEKSGGICAKVNWKRLEDDTQLANKVMDALPSGAATTAYVALYQNFINSCVVIQASADVREDGLRCKRILFSFCQGRSDGGCIRTTHLRCREESGIWWLKRDL